MKSKNFSFSAIFWNEIQKLSVFIMFFGMNSIFVFVCQ